MTGAAAHNRPRPRRPVRGLPGLLVCAVLLSACATVSGPAPVTDRSYGGKLGQGAGQPGVHVVRRGETVYGIAQRYDISTRGLIEQNSLRPPYRLSAGTQLRLPTAQVHTVRRGETLYAISRRYGVDTASLARANRLSAPYKIWEGQRLTMPYDARRGAPPVQTASVQRRPSSRAVTTAALPQVPRSQPGSAPAPSSPVSVAPPPVPQRDTGGFVWPVEGRILSSFGSQGAGLHNDGVNIAAPLGAPVRAVDNGVVAYAGDRIRGFGNMLLIKHSDGLITAYAHADKLLVDRGDVVSRGQVIARVGKSGGIPTPQLHFEVRKGTRAIDPRKVLPR